MDVALCANGWNNIGSGIMKTSDKCCTTLNHAVTIVGYHLCPENNDNDNDKDNNDNDNNDNDNNDGDNKPEPF